MYLCVTSHICCTKQIHIYIYINHGIYNICKSYTKKSIPLYQKNHWPVPDFELEIVSIFCWIKRENTRFFLGKNHICFLNALFPLKLQFAFWRSELFIFNNHSRIKIFEEGAENVFRKENTFFPLFSILFLRGVRRILLTKPFNGGKGAASFSTKKKQEKLYNVFLLLIFILTNWGEKQYFWGSNKIIISVYVYYIYKKKNLESNQKSPKRQSNL
jgi:hypothetical protein